MTRPARLHPSRSLLAAIALFVGLAALKAASLQFEHSLHSIDGVLQTWFALDNFANGNQLGRDFQSYLGISIILALLPAYLALGQTLYASTLAAYLLVFAGVLASAYAAAWFIRFIPSRQRCAVAVLLVFVFYFALPFPASLIAYTYPLALDPGFSLRPIRGFLPFFVLPVAVVCFRAILAKQSTRHALLLGLGAGVGLLWSNDAGIPLVIALTIALGLALIRQPAALFGALGAFLAGTALSAGALLMLVTHGEPGFWLTYNFVDVAGDQIWYFGPWDRAARIFGPADLIHVLQNARPISVLTLLSLIVCTAIAALRLLLGRGSRAHGAAFVFVGSSLIGTALLPQIGGHVGSGYNDITVFFGACAPLIIAQRPLLRLVRPIWRTIGAWPLHLAAWGSALLMIGIEAMTLTTSITQTDRTVFAPELGFHVSPSFAADLRAMERFADHWEAQGFAPDRRLLSVYTSSLDIAAGSQSPTAVGSLIHALGPENRAEFRALVERREVAGVTTIAPDYSGWEGWLGRANAGFFAALHANYRPIGRNDQHVLWVRREIGDEPPKSSAQCSVTNTATNRIELEIKAASAGIAEITLTRSGPIAASRSAVLTVIEDSPFTKAENDDPWMDFPRYGIANAPQVMLQAPVEAGALTALKVEMIDGSPIGPAACTAKVRGAITLDDLPSLPEAAQTAGAGAS